MLQSFPRCGIRGGPTCRRRRRTRGAVLSANICRSLYRSASNPLPVRVYRSANICRSFSEREQLIVGGSLSECCHLPEFVSECRPSCIPEVCTSPSMSCCPADLLRQDGIYTCSALVGDDACDAAVSCSPTAGSLNFGGKLSCLFADRLRQ